MHTDELVLAMIEIVGPLAQVEIDDADGVHLLHLVVLVAQLDVLGDGFRYTVEDAVQIVELTRLLYLHQNDFALRVEGLDVHAVELVVLGLLVALALQQFHDGHLLVEQHRHQALQDGIVRLVAKHALGCPVESYVLIHNPFFVSLVAKLRKSQRSAKENSIFSLRVRAKIHYLCLGAVFQSQVCTSPRMAR